MAMRRIDEVSNLDGDVDAKTVTIAFDEAKISLHEIKDALERVGYPAEE